MMIEELKAQGRKYQMLPNLFEMCYRELGELKVKGICACLRSFCSVHVSQSEKLWLMSQSASVNALFSEEGLHQIQGGYLNTGPPSERGDRRGNLPQGYRV